MDFSVIRLFCMSLYVRSYCYKAILFETSMLEAVLIWTFLLEGYFV